MLDGHFPTFFGGSCPARDIEMRPGKWEVAGGEVSLSYFLPILICVFPGPFSASAVGRLEQCIRVKQNTAPSYRSK